MPPKGRREEVATLGGRGIEGGGEVGLWGGSGSGVGMVFVDGLVCKSAGMQVCRYSISEWASG